MAFEAGQVVGEYKIVRVLGRGGLGAVYEATHLISQRAEAVKVMLPERTGTPEMKERFRREIQLLASLNHPNIAGLHNAFYQEDQLIMVMELVEGEDLRTRSHHARIPLPMLMDFGMQVLSALEYAHSRGVVRQCRRPHQNGTIARGSALVRRRRPVHRPDHHLSHHGAGRYPTPDSGLTRQSARAQARS